MTTQPTQHAGRLPDGTSLLIETWPDGTTEAKTKRDPWESWSPPIVLTALPAYDLSETPC